jgi:hypothetical protein
MAHCFGLDNSRILNKELLALYWCTANKKLYAGKRKDHLNG